MILHIVLSDKEIAKHEEEGLFLKCTEWTVTKSSSLVPFPGNQQNLQFLPKSIWFNGKTTRQGAGAVMLNLRNSSKR